MFSVQVATSIPRNQHIPRVAQAVQLLTSLPLRIITNVTCKTLGAKWMHHFQTLLFQLLLMWFRLPILTLKNRTYGKKGNVAYKIKIT